MAFQDFDLISARREQERKQKNKKIITIVAVVFVILLLAAAAAVGVLLYEKNKKNQDKKKDQKSANHNAKTLVTKEKAVESLCAPTDYKKTCEDSLLKEVKSYDSGKPEALIKAAFSVTSKEIDQAIKEAKDLKIEDSFKKAAFNDCLVLLEDAKEELNMSISRIDGKAMNKLSSDTPDLNNWLSAVMGYQQTCIDGFPDGDEKNAMQKLLGTSKELGSNALAVVSEVTSIFKTLAASAKFERKLLGVGEDGLPAWINENERRMLKDGPNFTPNVTVAKDGSGNFSTINDALNAMPQKYTGRYVIYIKQGVYEESVIITKKMVNITMYGDGSQKSIVTGSKNYVDGVPTYQTATFAAIGDGFLAQSIGFRNTAGPEKHQAVALRVQSDRAIFINCRMEAYQDTLYAQAHRHFYRSCYITGTVDFIFGDAAAVFQNCMIYVRKPMDNQQNTITAQGRIDKRETTGIVLQNCHILADNTLEPVKASFKSYLGRPWKEYSRTVVMETDIGDLIAAEGWLEWSGDFALKTLYYAEYNNKGAGSGTSGRVKWGGYRVIKRDEAVKFSVGPFLQGNSWIKGPDVPVRFGMFT